MTESENKGGNRSRFDLGRGRGNSSNVNKSNSNSFRNQQKNNNKPKERKLKSHIHNSTQHKSSDSWYKIVKTIMTKIQKIFDDSLDVVSSIGTKTKKGFWQTSDS